MNNPLLTPAQSDELARKYLEDVEAQRRKMFHVEQRWLACSKCEFEWELPCNFATAGAACPICKEGELHFHNDSDGEKPKFIGEPA